MGIKHSIVKAPGQRVFAVADWNVDHIVDSNLDIGAFNFTTTGDITGGDFYGKTLLLNANDAGNAVDILKLRAGAGNDVSFKVRFNNALLKASVIVMSANETIGRILDFTYGIEIANLRCSDFQLDFSVGTGYSFGYYEALVGAHSRWRFTNAAPLAWAKYSLFEVMASGGQAANPVFSVLDYSAAHVLDINKEGEVEAPKIKLTAIGGYAIKLTNKTGANSFAGDIVIASAGTADAVDWGVINELMAIGVFLDSGITDGSEAWVVVSGIAKVHMDAGGCALGDRIIAGATARRGQVNNAPAVAVHFQEIGHAIEIGAANATARCVLHFL